MPELHMKNTVVFHSGSHSGTSKSEISITAYTRTDSVTEASPSETCRVNESTRKERLPFEDRRPDNVLAI